MTDHGEMLRPSARSRTLIGSKIAFFSPDRQQQCSDPWGTRIRAITRPTLEAKAINIILIATIRWLGPA
jgi:hypothetical protein